MQRFPRTATNIIAAITLVAWVIASVIGKSNAAAYAFGFIPLRATVGSLGFPAAPVALTPLTATLVHAANPVHVGFNLLFLLLCGRQVERIIGTWGFLLLYVLGAYAAAAGVWFASPHSTTPMIGASGAISAVIGAYALSFGRAKAFTHNLSLNRWINVAWLMIAWVAIQEMMTWLSFSRGVLIATPAHIAGFAVGLLLQRPLLLWRYRKA